MNEKSRDKEILIKCFTIHIFVLIFDKKIDDKQSLNILRSIEIYWYSPNNIYFIDLRRRYDFLYKFRNATESIESEGSYQRISGSILWSEVESQWDRKTVIKEKKGTRERNARSIRKPQTKIYRRILQAIKIDIWFLTYCFLQSLHFTIIFKYVDLQKNYQLFVQFC